MTTDARSSLTNALLVFAFGVPILALSYLTSAQSPTIALAVIGSLLAGLITIVWPEKAVYILIFSMLLSPEIKLAELPRRTIVVRIDDLLLVTIFFVWLTKTALRKGLGFFAKTPLNRPILAYTAVCVLSTGFGIIRGDVTLAKSFFYVLKYIEYFFLFIMISNLVTSRKQVRGYLWAGAVTAVIVCLYAYAHIGEGRLYAPFDVDVKYGGEPATLGGYLLIIICMCLGFFTQQEMSITSFLPIAFTVFILPPFILTESRASYFGLFVSLFAAVAASKRKKIVLLIMPITLIVLLPLLAPSLYMTAFRRIKFTFENPRTVVNVGGKSVGLESSAAIRVDSWAATYTYWLPKHPIIGHGITGVGLVDAQYPLVIGETGLAGAFTFLWLLYALFSNTWKIARDAANKFDRGLAIGFFAVLAGLCAQAMTTNTFIIVRIMGPFWFLAACLMRLPSLPEDDAAPSPA